jgi:hypothetical protein
MRNKGAYFLYLVIIFLIAIYGFKKPNYNWDLLAYMAVVLNHDHQDPIWVHDSVYTIAKKQLPAAPYGQLVDGGLDFRKKLATDPLAFYQQMPFYAVKPLYTEMIYVFYKTGIPLVQASLLPSLIGFLLIGVLLLFWIRRYMQLGSALVFCILTMLSAPLWEVLHSFTPDCLSAFFLLAAMYFVFEKKSLLGVFIFLLLSIFVRLDNIIPAFFIISLLCFSGSWGPKTSITQYVLILLGLLIAFFSISFSMRRFGWNILYYPSFIHSMNSSYSFQPVFHIRAYMQLAFSHLMAGLFSSNLVLFLALAVLAFVKKNLQIRRLNFDQWFLCTLILIIAIRFLLQPIFTDRIYIAYYLSILILLVRKWQTQANPPV